MTRLVVTLLLLLAALAPSAQAAIRTEREPLGACRIDVQLVVKSSVSKSTLTATTKEIDRVWSPHGVTFQWGAQPSPTGTQRPLRILLNDDAMRGTGTQTLTERLAWIEFLEPGLPRDIINVAVGSARVLLERSKYSGRPVKELPPFTQDRLLAKVLGRAIAHEIGHYLLAESEHTPSGLMRGTFVAADLLAESLYAFKLDVADTLRLADAIQLGGQCETQTA